ncbi:hypothetical protein [Sphingorhabdus sp. Alg231-15]|uniref:hypothetical protein n=1 Tax=Sphingorhabdus sp. Alg231-15 TaxID=1922222 RepID=UPI00307C68D0
MVSLAMSSCTQDVLDREEYQRKLSAFEDSDIRIRRTLFDTGDRETCAIEIEIDLKANGSGNVIWSRPIFDHDWPMTPCVSDDSTTLKELIVSLDQHQHGRIRRSLAGLNWRVGFDTFGNTQIGSPIGCSFQYHPVNSHFVELKKKTGFMLFEIDPSCESVQVASAQLLIDDVIRLLIAKKNLIP